MRKMFIVIIAVLIVAGFGLSAEALAEALTVYNAANQVVADTAAKAEGRLLKTGIKAGDTQCIETYAELPCQLSVSVSNSKVDWTINSVGDYCIQAAKIDVITNINSDVTMKVEGAGNLVKTDDTSKSLDTYYNFRTATGAPAAYQYVAASSFNGEKKITVGNGTGTAYLWNMIGAKSGKPAGTYTDSFTVTFLQNL